MKKIFLLTLFAIISLLTHSVASRSMPVLPAFLSPGDKVAIISPAGSVSYSVSLAAANVLRSWGYTPVMGENLGKSRHGFAGSIAQREKDLLTALQDTSVKAIFCSNGGYGSVQLLCNIPLTVFRHNPKWIIGYSDITALHSANVSAGVMSIHSNMAYRLKRTGGDDTTSQALRGLLAGNMPLYRIKTHPLSTHGEAKGILVGGNMSVFTDLAESDYDFLNRKFMDSHDVILFIEDVHENLTHVDRMLHQLKIRGVLPRLKGLIIGLFKDYVRENGYASMEEMLHGYLKDYKFPICYKFPVGHQGDSNFPLIEGCSVVLNVSPDSTTLTFRPFMHSQKR